MIRVALYSISKVPVECYFSFFSESTEVLVTRRMAISFLFILCFCLDLAEFGVLRGFLLLYCICVLAFLHIPFFLAFSSDQLRQCPSCQAFSLARRPLIYRFLFELHYGYTRLNDQEYNLDDFLSSESSPLTRVH